MLELTSSFKLLADLKLNLYQTSRTGKKASQDFLMMVDVFSEAVLFSAAQKVSFVPQLHTSRPLTIGLIDLILVC
jgi:hypothetical protein